jgi:hypothetical protein
MISLLDVVKALHVLCMVGALGGLLMVQFGLPARARQDADNLRGANRLFNLLIGVGFLLGITLYTLKRGYTLGGHYNGVIGLKFVLLLGVGGLSVLMKRPGRGDGARLAAAGMMALAVLAVLSL